MALKKTQHRLIRQYPWLLFAGFPEKALSGQDALNAWMREPGNEKKWEQARADWKALGESLFTGDPTPAKFGGDNNPFKVDSTHLVAMADKSSLVGMDEWHMPMPSKGPVSPRTFDMTRSHFWWMIILWNGADSAAERLTLIKTLAGADPVIFTQDKLKDLKKAFAKSTKITFHQYEGLHQTIRYKNKIADYARRESYLEMIVPVHRVDPANPNAGDTMPWAKTKPNQPPWLSREALIRHPNYTLYGNDFVNVPVRHHNWLKPGLKGDSGKPDQLINPQDGAAFQRLSKVDMALKLIKADAFQGAFKAAKVYGTIHKGSINFAFQNAWSQPTDVFSKILAGEGGKDAQYSLLEEVTSEGAKSSGLEGIENIVKSFGVEITNALFPLDRRVPSDGTEAAKANTVVSQTFRAKRAWNRLIERWDQTILTFSGVQAAKQPLKKFGPLEGDYASVYGPSDPEDINKKADELGSPLDNGLFDTDGNPDLLQAFASAPGKHWMKTNWKDIVWGPIKNTNTPLAFYNNRGNSGNQADWTTVGNDPFMPLKIQNELLKHWNAGLFDGEGNKNESAEGLSRFRALEPLFSVRLNQGQLGAQQIPPAYKVYYIYLSWVLNCINQFATHGGKPALTVSDFFSSTDQEAPLTLAYLAGSLLSPAAEIADKIKEAQRLNDEVEKDSGSLVGEAAEYTPSAKHQILTNAQCFMLNTLDKWAAAHKGTFTPKEIVDNYSFTRILGECDHLPNLIGLKNHAVDKLLNIKPYELSLLQPRIRLYKERRIQDKNGSFKKSLQRLQVGAPFETKVNSENIKMFLSEGRGREFGSGIKEISITSEHGNRAFSVNELTNVEISFHFNRLDEMFLNWPIYKKDKDDNIIEKSVTYPFGITPGYEDNPPASVAELVFPINTQQSDVLKRGYVDLNRPGFAVALEVGWSVPDQFLPGFNLKGKKSFLAQLAKQTLYKTYILTPTDSEFNIRENGTVELKVTYYGIQQHLQNEPINRLFPPSTTNDLADPALKRDVVKLRKEARNEKNKKKKDILRRKLEKKMLIAQDQVTTGFLSKSIARLFKALMDDKLYHRAFIPKTFLGIRSKDKKVVRWSPYTEMSIYRDYTPKKTAFVKSAGDVTRKGRASTGNAIKDILKSVENVARMSTKAQKLTLKENKSEAAKIKAARKKAAVDAVKANLNISDPKGQLQAIDFLYFGDIAQLIIQFAKEQHELHAAKIAKPGESIKTDLELELAQTNFIFGSITIPLFYGDEERLVNVNIADIPIVANLFVEFMLQFIVRPENYDVSNTEFIIELYRYIIWNYFSPLCFQQAASITGASPEIGFFDLYSKGRKKNNRGAYHTPIPQGFSARPVWKKANFRKAMKKYEADLAKGKGQSLALQKNYVFHYCYLGAQTTSQGDFNYKNDRDKGIHHFYIGRDVGMVKKIEFTSKEIEGRAEAVWSVIGSDIDKAMFMIPRVYDVNVTMVGNNMFETGQTFYVNPTLGTTLFAGSNTSGKSKYDIIKNTGLGGYYYISKISTVIRSGKYETILEGIKIGLAIDNATKSLGTHTPDYDPSETDALEARVKKLEGS